MWLVQHATLSNPRGELPYKKNGSVCRKILKRTPKRCQDPVLWAWHDSFFTPKRYQIMGFNKTKLKISYLSNVSCNNFLAQYPKRYR